MKLKPLALLLGCTPLLAQAAVQGTTLLDEIVVTAPRMLEPLTVVNDPKAPQQPVPANDGASFLKNIPGFAVIRKGGTDGDPVLRGLAGSRLNLLIDGAELLGGCGMRMDPPTAYVFPEVFDQVTVLKGPQSVLHGNGNLAGVVLFERDPRQFGRSHASASLMAGGWGRLDAVASGTLAGEKAYAQASASYAESDDYEDGAGAPVHAFYTRKSLNAVGGWTPDAHTRIELSAVASAAEAAYADRTMDGVKFDRDGYSLKFERRALGPLVQKVTAQAYYSYIDHVMDNFSLRTLSGMAMVNNPDRETQGARVAAELALTDATLLTLGADWQQNVHTLRTGSGASAYTYESRPRVQDMDTRIAGLYGELRHDLGEGARLVGGLRFDDHAADRYNTTSGAFVASADTNLSSGFLRYERDLSRLPATVFVGLGHAQRPMDFWEASTYNGLTAASQLNPEQNTQLDTGLVWRNGGLSGSVSAWYSRIDDYILTHVTGACSTPGNCTAANNDVTRHGGEADLAWRFRPQWTLRGNLAYVHGENDTRGTPLAQTPPLEARLGLDYRTGPWTWGGVLRMVARQDRVDVGYGNIVGTDIGPTPGFATLALNSAWQAGKKTLISAGVDNLLDKRYAEHISRAGATVAGYAQTTRVNEPGRFFWIKASIALD